jgi:hypothetical protein
MGRPPTPIDEEKLAVLCRLRPSLKDVCYYFDCSEDAIERYIRKHHNMTFAEYRHKQMTHTRVMLVTKAIGMAEKGNTAMLIFCLKNLCGWSDRPEACPEDDEIKKMSTKELIILVKDTLQIEPKNVHTVVQAEAKEVK